MLLKNKSARLITINGQLNEKGERTAKYQIKPGKNPSVEVPDELCKSDFVKALLADEALIAVAADPTKPDLPKPKTLGESESLYADFDKAQLVVQCEERGIEVSSRDTKTTLIAKLEASDE